jgi:hypothetical protein
MRSTSQISCSIVFPQVPPNMCQLPVCCCTDPFYWGCIFKRAGYSDEERLVGSQVYIPTCLPVACDDDGGSLLPCTSRENPTAGAPKLLIPGEFELASDTNAGGNALSMAHGPIHRR